MNPYKLKHMTPYQRRRYFLKQLLRIPEPTWWDQLKIMWYRGLLDATRRVQFLENQDN